MTRIASFVVLALALVVGGCDKPTEASCRKALDNMRRVMGTDNLTDNNKNEGEVRRCKGGSSKKSVQCAVDAKSYDELRACGFSKLPATLPVTTTGGSGPAAAGSAAGSAMMGSATDATGSAAGSSAAGAAAGSAAAGSAGSANGSPTGAAAGSDSTK